MLAFSYLSFYQPYYLMLSHRKTIICAFLSVPTSNIQAPLSISKSISHAHTARPRKNKARSHCIKQKQRSHVALFLSCLAGIGEYLFLFWYDIIQSHYLYYLSICEIYYRVMIYYRVIILYLKIYWKDWQDSRNDSSRVI
jgi:hypothetical protein